MDEDYSINSITELNNAPVRALLYQNSDDTGYTLVLSGNDAIIIPGYNNNNDWFYPWYGMYWGESGILTSSDFADNIIPDIKRIEIRNGITAIGDRAFRGMEMEYVEIPGSVEYIGGVAFGSCPNLIDVNFADDFNGEFATNDGVSYTFFFTDWIYSLVGAGLATETSYSSRVDVNYTINGTPWIFVWVVD